MALAKHYDKICLKQRSALRRIQNFIFEPSALNSPHPAPVEPSSGEIELPLHTGLGMPLVPRRWEI
ncbi:hypothetical protein I7I48_01156 [Histoplasma ohiense]|nr:hypothetical protein I7I48_01156 [Histoplasma ohiense (nom. inval.)]